MRFENTLAASRWSLLTFAIWTDSLFRAVPLTILAAVEGPRACPVVMSNPTIITGLLTIAPRAPTLPVTILFKIQMNSKPVLKANTFFFDQYDQTWRTRQEETCLAFGFVRTEWANLISPVLLRLA